MPLQSKKINELLTSLEEKIPPELLEDLLILKSTLLPDTKSPQTCIFGGDKVSTFNLHCCGGKITPTEIFACEIKDVTIKRQCHHCDSYHPTMEKEDQTNEES